MLDISDPELREQVEKFMEVLLVVARLYGDLDSRHCALIIMAERLELDSNELTAAVEATAHQLLWRELDTVCSEFGSTMTCAVVEHFIKQEALFPKQLKAWLDAKKGELAEDDVYASADEHVYGYDD